MSKMDSIKKFRGLWLLVLAVLFFGIYSLTAPQNHSEAEDVYHFSKVVEQGSFSDQVGVNRVLALPFFGVLYQGAQALGYSGRAFPFMIFINRLLAVGSLLLFFYLLRNLRPNISSFAVLFLGFSYGFWRYANEAETYMLAAVLVLGAWGLVLSNRWKWAVVISALGVLVHLLNLIPLLLIIPLYYLLSKSWKKALLHGGLTGLLVLVGYALCFQVLDWGELGAQHHAEEAGFGFSNMLRSGIAFGQCLISGNFLFGFEGFRELLTRLFPTRMLGEEFYMATYMPSWIPFVGAGSLLLIGISGLWLGIRALTQRESKAQSLKPKAVLFSCMAWLFLYAVAVMRTESGSPELWILALIPFWLLIAPFLKGRIAIFLLLVFFTHNLVAGLLPVMSKKSDYHVEKGRWLVENCTTNDLILTSYEPVMIFYLDYFSVATVLNSGELDVDKIEELLENRVGKAYALSTFFQPLESMRMRSSAQYEKMRETGLVLFSRFGKVKNDEFGGIYELRKDVLSH